MFLLLFMLSCVSVRSQRTMDRVKITCRLYQIQFESYTVDQIVVDLIHFKHSKCKSYRFRFSFPINQFLSSKFNREFCQYESIHPYHFSVYSYIPVTRQQFNTSLGQSLIFNVYHTPKFKSYSCLDLLKPDQTTGTLADRCVVCGSVLVCVQHRWYNSRYYIYIVNNFQSVACNIFVYVYTSGCVWTPLY
jgi:hypothetical protein